MPLDYNDNTSSNGGITAVIDLWVRDKDNTKLKTVSGTFDGYGTNYNGSVNNNYYTLYPEASDAKWFDMDVIFTMTDRTRFAKKGDSFDLQVSGLYSSYREHGPYNTSTLNSSTYHSDYTFKSGVIDPTKYLKKLQMWTKSNSGSWHEVKTITENFSDYIVFNSNGTYTFNGTYENVPHDVYQVSVELTFDKSWISPSGTSSQYNSYGHIRYIDFIQGFQDSTFTLTTPDETTGLLSGIIEWLRSIRDGIVNVGTGVTNVFNSILELPANLSTSINNKLSGLGLSKYLNKCSKSFL